jgi:hypothetical protein
MPDTGPSYAERRLDARYALVLAGTAEPLYRRSMERAREDPSLRGQDRFRVEIVNLSRGGFMLAFDAEVSDGDVLRLAFRHPESHAELGYEVQIQWMRKNTTGLMGRFCAGVAFRDRAAVDVDALVVYAQRMNPTPER